MMNVSPVMQELQEGPAGIVVVLRDITALKQLEIAKSMFVSMVAHELKSPLSAVESYLNLILRGTVAGDSEKAHNMLERSLLRLSTLQKMISELMNLTAMETGKFSITRSHIDFGHMLAEAVASCQEDAQQKNITISLSCESSPPVNHVLADRDAMLIVFRNLIHNAVKYNNDNGHVDILVHQKDNYLVVTVQDDGVGMTLEDRERVFEEFFRAKNRKTSQTPGTGLGLSLVKRLVDMHHGTIAVSSELDKGSVFTVSIPMKG